MPSNCTLYNYFSKKTIDAKCTHSTMNEVVSSVNDATLSPAMLACENNRLDDLWDAVELHQSSGFLYPSLLFIYNQFSFDA